MPVHRSPVCRFDVSAHPRSRPRRTFLSSSTDPRVSPVPHSHCVCSTATGPTLLVPADLIPGFDTPAASSRYAPRGDSASRFPLRVDPNRTRSVCTSHNARHITPCHPIVGAAGRQVIPSSETPTQRLDSYVRSGSPTVAGEGKGSSYGTHLRGWEGPLFAQLTTPGVLQVLGLPDPGS